MAADSQQPDEPEYLWHLYVRGGLDLVERRRLRRALEASESCRRAHAAALEALEASGEEPLADDERSWCYSEATLGSFRREALSPEDAGDVAEHLAVCDLCVHLADYVAHEADREEPGPRSVERAERPVSPARQPRPEPSRMRRRRMNRRTAWRVAAAAALVAVIAGIGVYSIGTPGSEPYPLGYRVRTLQGPTGELSGADPKAASPADRIEVRRDDRVELQVEFKAEHADRATVSVTVTPPTGSPLVVEGPVPAGSDAQFVRLSDSAAPLDVEVRREVGRLLIRLASLPPLGSNQAAIVQVSVKTETQGCQRAQLGTLEVELQAAGERADPAP